MSLTLGRGPLAGDPSPGNYAIDGPKHRLLFQDFPRRVRGEVGGEGPSAYFDVTLPGGGTLRDAARSPAAPEGDAAAARDHVSFRGDDVELLVDGERVDVRRTSVRCFSAPSA